MDSFKPKLNTSGNRSETSQQRRICVMFRSYSFLFRRQAQLHSLAFPIYEINQHRADRDIHHYRWIQTSKRTDVSLAFDGRKPRTQSKGHTFENFDLFKQCFFVNLSSAKCCQPTQAIKHVRNLTAESRSTLWLIDKKKNVTVGQSIGRSFIHTAIHSVNDSFIYSVIHSFIQSVSQSVSLSFNHSSKYDSHSVTIIHSVSDFVIQLVIYSCIYSFYSLFHSVNRLMSHSFILSFSQ